MPLASRSLLALCLSIGVASCSLDDHGLGAMDARPPGFDGGALTGAAGSSSTGQAGDIGSSGGAGTNGAAGTDPTGAAGTAPSGAAGTSPTGAAGSGAAGDGAAGTDPTGAAGSAPSGAAGTSPTGAAGSGNPILGQIGCSDGTREGYLDRAEYQKIAACSGAWEDPGLVSGGSRTPQCERRAGNDGDRDDGRGCSVADLCASGWHVCTGAKEVAALGTTCTDAVAPFDDDDDVFFVTRQRATGLLCDDTGIGTNNLYGCGTIGTTADRSCAPFTNALRDSDCQSNFPWVCSFGPVGTSQEELNVVVKRSSSRGGVLCCRDQ
jgi:hypothetical protein